MSSRVVSVFSCPTPLYDEVKTKAFKKLSKTLPDDKYHVGNIKIDIETDKNTIFCHLVGTIYMKKEKN